LGVVRLAVCEPMSQKLDPSTGSGGTTGTRRSSNSCFKGETWGSPAQDRLWATWPEIRLAEERTDARGASEKQVRSLGSEWKERKARAQTGPDRFEEALWGVVGLAFFEPMSQRRAWASGLRKPVKGWLGWR
jgi:hypothetical protein